jgi:hypothetical protein
VADAHQLTLAERDKSKKKNAKAAFSTSMFPPFAAKKRTEKKKKKTATTKQRAKKAPLRHLSSVATSFGESSPLAQFAFCFDCWSSLFFCPFYTLLCRWKPPPLFIW